MDLEEYVRTIFRDSVDITLNDTVIIREVEYIRGIQVSVCVGFGFKRFV